MKNKRAFTAFIAIVDIVVIVLVPLFIVITGYVASLFPITLGEFWSTFVTWYIPADIFLAAITGICGLLYSILIVTFAIIGAYITLKGHTEGKIILFVVVLINSIVQVLGLSAHIYYAEANWGPMPNRNLLIGSRIVYSILITIGNLLMLFTRGQASTSIQ